VQATLGGSPQEGSTAIEPEELARDGELSIRRMRHDPDDYASFVRWRNAPHVAAWWTTDDEPTPITLEGVIEAYGPRAEDGSWVAGCVICVDARPIGYVQYYPWSGAADEAREAGIADVEGSYGLDICSRDTSSIDSARRRSRC
jgi:GNAT acetyltransferase-like protein